MPIPIIYRTMTMLAAVRQMPTHNTFLRDRYFPTQDAQDIFPTEDVLVEYKDGNKKMAPCVMPRKKGITIARDGYRTQRYTPPYIAPQRALTIDDLNRKGFGESLYSEITPEQREAQVLGQDLTEFDTMIATREEYIAAQALLNNGYVLRHYADEYGSDKYDEFEIRFYDGNNNPGIYTPDEAWNATGSNIFGDLQSMIQLLTSKGLPATDLVIAPDVAATLLDDQRFQKYLDIKNYNMGTVAPAALPAGAASLCRINVYGRSIEVFTYDETYQDEQSGAIMPFIPAGNIVLTAPAAGRGLYGAVSQLEESDGRFHTYASRRIPKYTADAENDVRTLKVTSRPLYIPRHATPWISAKVQ
jgi:hypothetical protein